MKSETRRIVRICLATIVTIMVALGVWKYIDYQTQPPPPPKNLVTPAPAP